MAYDRYVAICNPLLYMVIMSPGICVQLVVAPYGYSFLVALFHTILTFRLSYCHSNLINHLYCDDMPLLRLASSLKVQKSKFHIKINNRKVSNSMQSYCKSKEQNNIPTT